jgi:hypothetical protein
MFVPYPCLRFDDLIRAVWIDGMDQTDVSSLATHPLPSDDLER